MTKFDKANASFHTATHPVLVFHLVSFNDTFEGLPSYIHNQVHTLHANIMYSYILPTPFIHRLIAMQETIHADLLQDNHFANALISS